jgi:putative tryptophan/tyrosine transport system substrate-binding protein
MGIQLSILTASTEPEIDSGFASLANLHVRALIVAADPFFNNRVDELVGLAARLAIPAMYIAREFAVAGGLISYGPSFADTYHHAGVYVGKILNGTKPEDLPVVQPSKFELIVNLKTAKALGLTVPQSIVARADEVIE